MSFCNTASSIFLHNRQLGHSQYHFCNQMLIIKSKKLSGMICHSLLISNNSDRLRHCSDLLFLFTVHVKKAFDFCQKKGEATIIMTRIWFIFHAWKSARNLKTGGYTYLKTLQNVIFFDKNCFTKMQVGYSCRLDVVVYLFQGVINRFLIQWNNLDNINLIYIEW